MGAPPELRVFGILITLFLIFWTGSCFFVAIHPRAFWRFTQGWKAVREPSRVYFLLMRIQGVLMGAAGLFLLASPYLHR